MKPDQTGSVALTDLTANTLGVCMLLLILVLSIAQISKRQPVRETQSLSTEVSLDKDMRFYQTLEPTEVVETFYRLSENRRTDQQFLIVWKNNLELNRPGHEVAKISVRDENQNLRTQEVSAVLQALKVKNGGQGELFLIINSLPTFASIQHLLPRDSHSIKLVHSPQALLLKNSNSRQSNEAWNADFSRLLKLNQTVFGFQNSLRYILQKNVAKDTTENDARSAHGDLGEKRSMAQKLTRPVEKNTKISLKESLGSNLFFRPIGFLVSLIMCLLSMVWLIEFGVSKRKP